jgi:predicted transcriptional regulator
MEQVLIKELIKLMCKSGCETFVGNFQKDIREVNLSEKWTDAEIEEAVAYVKYMNEYFGKDEAVAVVTSLIAKYNIDAKDLNFRPSVTSPSIV